jgi:type I restriction enzyme S subunit
MPTDIVNGKIEEDKIAYIGNQKAEELINYRLKENDILFPRRGDLTKRALVSKSQENWICGTGTIRVRLNNGINPKVVYYAVNSNSTNNWLKDSSVGTTMPNINASTVKNIPFHLPEGPLAASVLNEIESSINSSKIVQSHIHSLLNLKKSLINQIF